MSLLPDTLVVLSRSGEAVPGSQFKRVSAASEEARALSEANWDDIICTNVRALADAFRAANVIAPDSTLRVIGRQVDKVDVLLAEVPATDESDPSGEVFDGEPRRLVLLEDKLVRSPEAKRQVLAQLLDYAQKAQTAWTVDFLCKTVSASAARWLRLHAPRINVMLAQGEVLLVIAGDDIDEDLLRLARRFAAGADPLSLAELCLVAMSVYRRGDELLLVPHVVSAVERHQRQLSIRVTVQTEDGTVLPARIERDPEAEVEAARRGALPTNQDAEAFLKRARAVLDPVLCGERSQYRATANSRKVLVYWFDADRARLKIHFGGYVRDGWSPILVGLQVESEEQRDQ